MDVSRLLAVINDIEFAYKEGLSKLLADLIQQYTAARDTPAQDNTNAIQKTYRALIKYLEEDFFQNYPPSKDAVLKAIGGKNRVGLGFRQELDSILSVPGQTTAGIVTGLTNLQTKNEAFKKACSQTKNGLEALGLSAHTIPEGQFEVGVLIPEDLVDKNLSMLAKELETWNKIVRGFQEVAGDEEREVTVAGLASGSYEVYLPLGLIAASLVSRTIDRILAWYLQILEIRKRRLELKELGAPVAEVDAVKKHEKDLLEREIKSLAKELLKEVNPKADASRKNELETHLTISIRQIARFVDRGGTVEVDATPPEEPEEPIAPAGDDVSPEKTDEYNGLKNEFIRLRSESEKIYKIISMGSSLMALPERPEPILQLTEAECDENNSDIKAPPKKKS